MDEVELIGGPEKRAIVIEPYRSAWAAAFEEHRGRIEDALGSVACRVDHIGSTAVAGLAAKPIIDIQISVLDVEQESSYMGPLLGAGYRLRVREAGHRMFRTPELDVHIHICEATGVAARLGGAPGEALLDGARSAYVHGMGTALVVAVGVALAGAVVVLLFLPARGEPMPE